MSGLRLISSSAGNRAVFHRARGCILSVLFGPLDAFNAVEARSSVSSKSKSSKPQMFPQKMLTACMPALSIGGVCMVGTWHLASQMAHSCPED